MREYVIEGLAGGEWKALCEGTAIGHKKIDRFAPVTVERVRLRCLRSEGRPHIRRLAVFSVYGDKGTGGNQDRNLQPDADHLEMVGG